MQADDLAEFSSEWVEPISIDYRGWRFTNCRPTDGMAALEILNIMATSPPAKIARASTAAASHEN